MRELSPDLARSEVRFEFIRPPDRSETFNARLLEASDTRIVLTHKTFRSKAAFVVDGEEVIGWGYDSVWFLYKNEPFDVARFYRPDGTWTGYYVDVLEPVRWSDADASTVEPVVDLFLDVWIGRDGAHQVLDADEFQEAVLKNWLSEEQAALATSTLAFLEEETRAGRFPPDGVRNYDLTGGHKVDPGR